LVDVAYKRVVLTEVDQCAFLTAMYGHLLRGEEG